MQPQQRQVVWSINHSHVHQPETDCFTYIAQQWQFYIEHLGFVAKKVLCKSWPRLSKSSRRRKKEQVNIDLPLSRRKTNLTRIDRNKCILIIKIYT